MSRHPRGAAILSASIALAGVAGIVILGSMAFSQPDRPRGAEPPPASFMEVAAQVGLDPDSLAAAGVDARAAPTLIAGTRAFATAHGRQLATLNATVQSAQNTLDRIGNARNTGPTSPQEVTQASDASGALATARQARATLLNQAFAEVTAGLSGQQRQLLQTIRANSLWSVPVHFKTVNRSPQEWVTLQHALAPSSDDSGRSSASAVRAAALADPAVSTALTNLEANGASIDQAFRNAMANR